MICFCRIWMVEVAYPSVPLNSSAPFALMDVTRSLEAGQSGSVYTPEIGKHYKLSPLSQRTSHETFTSTPPAMLSFLFFFPPLKSILFLRTISSPQHSGAGSPASSHTPLPLVQAHLPHHQQPSASRLVCLLPATSINAHVMTCQSPQSVEFGQVQCHDRSHHYGIMQNCFITLKILSALPLHLFPSPCPQPLAASYLCTVCIVLPFPECRVVSRII